MIDEYPPPVVECCNPACSETTLHSPGAPGPVGWLDVSRWNGEWVEQLLYSCSWDCLIPTLEGVELLPEEESPKDPAGDIECGNPACSARTVWDGPAPLGWVDVSRWDGTRSWGFFNFCSLACLLGGLEPALEQTGNTMI